MSKGVAVLDGQLLQGDSQLLLDDDLHGVENAVEHCLDSKLIIAPNAVGQKVLIFFQ